MKTFLFTNGLPESILKMNNQPDGRIIRHRQTVTASDGRVFWEKKLLNDTTGEHMEIITNKFGTRYNVNLNNGNAYQTTL